LAAFRVALGVVLLADLWIRSGSMVPLLTDEGFFTRELAMELAPQPLFSPFHMATGSVAGTTVLMVLQALLAGAFIVGFRTRVIAAISLVMLVSLHQRNLLATSAIDSLFRFYLLWCIFLPMGESWSVDALRSRRREHRWVCSVASAALLLQAWFLYWHAVVSKFQADAWLEGRAVYSVLAKASYAQPLGDALLAWPEVLHALTMATLFIEGAVVVLLFLPWATARVRIGVFFVNFFFQLGLWLCLDIGVFQPLAMAVLIPFLPSRFWERIGRARAVELRAWQPRSRRLERLRQAICASLLFVCSTSVVVATPKARPFVPEPLPTLYNRAFLYQSFRLFANTDSTLQGWWLVLGRPAEGRLPINLMTGEDVTDPYARPFYFVGTQWGQHWIMFHRGALRPRYRSRVFPAMAEWFCAHWNDENPDRLVRDVQIVLFRENNYAPDVVATIEQERLSLASCESRD